MSRSVIEKSYPQECEEREGSLTPEDRGLLARFRQAKEKESQWKDNVVPRLRRQEIQRLVTGLCCIFAVVLTLLVRIQYYESCFTFYIRESKFCPPTYIIIRVAWSCSAFLAIFLWKFNFYAFKSYSLDLLIDP